MSDQVTNTTQEKITRIRARLEKLYDAESNALEMQSVSNAEGEAQAYASLSTIQKSIRDLEAQLDLLLNEAKGTVTMYWSL